MGKGRYRCVHNPIDVVTGRVSESTSGKMIRRHVSMKLSQAACEVDQFISPNLYCLTVSESGKSLRSLLLATTTRYYTEEAAKLT